MKKVEEFRRHLRRGKVYRRSDLEQYSTAVDRHLSMVKEGVLQKIAAGMYLSSGVCLQRGASGGRNLDQKFFEG
jgi:hypothetical protein